MLARLASPRLGPSSSNFRIALARRRRRALLRTRPLHAIGEHAVERLGDLGDPLTEEVSRHGGEDGLSRPRRLFLIGKGKQSFGGVENAPGSVLDGRADRRQLAQRVDEHRSHQQRQLRGHAQN
jgi:hypothetical protein